MRHLVGILVFVSMAGASSVAWARPTTTLRYDAEPGLPCPDEAGFRARVAEEVGYDPFSADARERSVSVVLRRAQGFEAGLEVVGPGRASSSRTLRSAAGCDDLVSSLALAIAVALDPEVLEAAPAPPPPAPAPAPRAPPAEVVFVPVNVPVFVERPQPPPADDRLRGIATVSMGVGAGYVPGTSFGPSIAVGLQQRSWELAAELTAFFPGEASFGGHGAVVVSTLLAGVAPCVTPLLASRVRAMLCGHLAVGAASVSAEGVAEEKPSVEVAAFTGPRAGVGVSVTDTVDVRVLGELAVDLVPLEVSITTGDERLSPYEGGPLAGRALAGLTVGLP